MGTEEFLSTLSRFGLEAFGRYYSIYRGRVAPKNRGEIEAGKVSGNVDPMNQGRIRVIVPALGSNAILPEPAYPISPFAAKGAGMFFPPDEDDLVYVLFENGNPRLPLYIGGWWLNPREGGAQAPGKTDLPEEFRKGKSSPTVRGIRTKAGHEILFDDTPGEEKVVIQTGGKGHQVVLDDVKDRIVVSKREGDEPLIEIDPGGRIRLFSSGAQEAFVLGTTFLRDYRNHIHQTPDGPSGPPIPNGIYESQNIFGE